ncbi:MAG: TonB-dependent receptor plug domain-containing protein, partial [Saprospiraceae bacterium]
MKKLSLVLVLFLCALGTMLAQRTITGTISDDKGEALIGASVVVKGAEGVGTTSDIDGSYSLDIPAGSDVLVISYTGYGTKEMTLGASNVMNVSLTEGSVLGEIVVTGLGIKKEKKALGYAVTTIDSKDIELKPEADVTRVLRGKVAGVQIGATSGLAGSGTNVIIRGYSSITGSNQPLFVVDGVPFNSDTNADRGALAGSSSASSRFLDLDPNNIAEVNVLKGLSATVLYGEAGRNGVILITTKAGSDNMDQDK